MNAILNSEKALKLLIQCLFSQIELSTLLSMLTVLCGARTDGHRLVVEALGKQRYANLIKSLEKNVELRVTFKKFSQSEKRLGISCLSML